MQQRCDGANPGHLDFAKALIIEQCIEPPQVLSLSLSSVLVNYLLNDRGKQGFHGQPQFSSGDDQAVLAGDERAMNHPQQEMEVSRTLSLRESL